MAQQEVTGIPADEIPDLRAEFQENNESKWYDFEERYCLFQIPHQPEDYDGPRPRYCKARCSYHDEETNTWRCKAHRGKGVPNPEYLTEGNPKHYMYATDEFLMDNLTDEEQTLYEEIMGWAEVYGINQEDDPAAYDDLKLLAKQRVREVKASKYVLDEGEIVESFIRDEEGNIVTDDEGQPKTEDDINPASEEYRRLVSLIKDLKRELGITRRERLKAQDRSQVADAADSTSEAMNELVSDEDEEFDIDEYE